MPRIYGERIMLREYQKEDLEHIRGWVNDPAVVGNLSDVFLYPHSLNETESFLNAVLEGKVGAERVCHRFQGDGRVYRPDRFV